MINLFRKQRPSSLLGLSLDGNRLEGVVLRRTNGALTIKRTLFASLSLDPLTNDPELVGREIRNQLNQAGIRETRCAVCVPLSWVLTLQTKVPDLPEADISSFLQLEAERGFPYGPDTLLVSSSRYRSPGGDQYATQVAIPKDHIVRVGKALKAARLRPLAFTVGILALQDVASESSDGVLALAIGETSVGLLVCCGRGVAALRTLEGTLETEGGRKRPYADVVARECRITLGQLPSDVREAVRRVRVFGRSDLAEQLAHEIRPRVESLGLKVELVTGFDAADLGVQPPPEAVVSPAFSLAARQLVGRGPGIGFLLPRTTRWQQISARYASRRVIWAGTAAASAALLVACLFIYQQWQLSKLGSEWAKMRTTVHELEEAQTKIRRFRPWFDDSLCGLTILRRLTEAFPEDGSVTAKVVEIRDLSVVTCSGISRDNQALLRTLARLRSVPGIPEVNLGPTRGQSPAIQFTFTFNFRGSEGENSAN
jgi:hypothetical protein